MALQFAVIGNPIAHSRSPDIPYDVRRSGGHRADLSGRLRNRKRFGRVLERLVKQGFRGANVTLPFKEEALAISARASDRATRAGAANTLSFDAGGIAADNTDGAGLLRDLAENIGIQVEGQRVW